MKQRKVYTIAAMLVFILSFSPAAVPLPIVIDAEFPYAVLIPTAPTMDDSVALQIIIGNNSNNCASPYLASFRIVQVSDNVCVRAPCPQDYLIKVGYRPSPYQTDVICPMIAGPYGPTCRLGKLDVGSYTVIDTTAGYDTLLVFFVTEERVTRDSVVVTPKSPTTKDSLDISLFGANLGCGGTVHDDTALVVDTCIYLSFSYQECLACDCASMGRWIPFNTKPLKAGTYGIYKMQNYYCAPGTPCPLIAAIPVRVGQVTVRANTAVSSQRTIGKSVASMTFDNTLKMLTVTLPASQALSLELFNVQGRKVATMLQKSERSDGIYTFSLENFTDAHGCFLARLKNDRGETILPIYIGR